MGTLKKRLIFQAHLGCDFIPTTVTNKGPLLGSQILVTRFTKKNGTLLHYCRKIF